MAVAQPDTDTLLADLNSAREAGTNLTNEFLIRKIKRIIEKTKDDLAHYHLSLASLYVLTGEYGLMKKHGEIGLKLTDALGVAYHCVTLASGGFYSEARKVFDTLGEEVFFKENGEIDLYYVKGALSHFAFSRLLSIMGNKHQDSYTIANETHTLLEKHGIEEHTLLKMMDLAGQFLRERHLISPKDPVLIPNPYNQTLNISIPLNLSADEMAKLEWEFVNLLFEKMPNAPLEAVHIGFCCTH